MPEVPEITTKSATHDVRLLHAAKDGDLTRVEALLKEGLNVNEQDGEGITPLIIASCAGNLDVVKALLTDGADTSIEDKLGWNAYKSAMLFGDLKGHTLEPFKQIMELIKKNDLSNSSNGT